MLIYPLKKVIQHLQKTVILHMVSFDLVLILFGGGGGGFMSVLQVCFKDKANPECTEADSGKKSNQDGLIKKTYI